MADFQNNSQGKKPFKFDTKILLFVVIGLVTLNLFISYYLLTVYQGLIKPVLPLDLQVKEAIETQKEMYKMTERIKKVANGKSEEE